MFDAHDRAFAFFKGGCTRGIYEKMKTAVDAVFVGKERAYNRCRARVRAKVNGLAAKGRRGRCTGISWSSP